MSGSQHRRLDPPRSRCRPAPWRLEHLELGLDVEAVAGLDLDRRDPALHQCPQARARLLHKLFQGSRPRRLHGRGDAAAGAGDFLIGRALEPLLIFAGAVAAEDEVGVAIDQAGGDPGAVQRLDLSGLVAGQLGAAADPDDAPVLDADGAILDRPEGAGTAGSMVAMLQSRAACPTSLASIASWL